MRESLQQELERLQKEISQDRTELLEAIKDYKKEALPAHIHTMEIILANKISRVSEIRRLLKVQSDSIVEEAA